MAGDSNATESASQATRRRSRGPRAEVQTARVSDLTIQEGEVRRVGDKAKLTIKGRTEGFTRGEWEYPIPAEDASELIERFCGPRCIEKTRHYLTVGSHEWVIDEFAGRHVGLLLAEIELESEDEPFERSNWIGEEVSHDPRYYNEVLANPE